MTEIIDIISPRTIGEDLITITVDPISLPILAGNVITLNFDYSRTSPGGVVLPMVLQAQPGEGRGTGYFEHVFRRTRPGSFAFPLPFAGEWLAVLRECGHNYWLGRITLNVGGEQFSQILSTRQEP